MRFRARLLALLPLALAARSALPAELPPGVGQWMSGILAHRDQAHAIARAPRTAMAHVDGRFLAAELALVCRAVELAARDARVRSRVPSDSIAGRVRAAFLPAIAKRLKARTECLASASTDSGAGVGDLARRIDDAIALLDLADEELHQVRRALAAVEREDGDMNEAILEVGDWETRYDELVRKLAVLNLALRHVHHGQSVGGGDRSFEHLRELLDDEDE